ncbi:hypothetical protein ElyMa_004494800 [Elysia marginata]|uniref:Uncharacterized protein n=1 Tax=Elysia marginata TaxID=1093978 RepID=A0AAV4HL95_9GAST|nr:hypothetical protein ElyMa_004494800 [Elysia marginata]
MGERTGKSKAGATGMLLESELASQKLELQERYWRANGQVKSWSYRNAIGERTGKTKAVATDTLLRSELTKQPLEWQTPLYTVSFDFQKPFNRKVIRILIHRCRFPPKFITIVHQLYEYATSMECDSRQRYMGGTYCVSWRSLVVPLFSSRGMPSNIIIIIIIIIIIVLIIIIIITMMGS